MANTRPESWVGENVIVALAIRNPKEFTGRLDEVNDRGVVLTLSPDSMHGVEAFYPWDAIRRMRLKSKKEELDPRSAPQSGNRLPGDPGWFS
ncbi:hypothetical protein BH23ACT11_BH23ACT11_20020 [soil metagenome]